MQSFHGVDCLNLWIKLNPDHHTRPANISQNVWIFPLQVLQSIQQKFSDPPRVSYQIAALDHIEDSQRHRASQWRPAKCRCVRPRREESGKFLPHPKRANWKPAAKPFRDRNSVGKKCRCGTLQLFTEVAA